MRSQVACGDHERRLFAWTPRVRRLGDGDLEELVDIETDAKVHEEDAAIVRRAGGARTARTRQRNADAHGQESCTAADSVHGLGAR